MMGSIGERICGLVLTVGSTLLCISIGLEVLGNGLKISSNPGNICGLAIIEVSGIKELWLGRA